VILYCRWVEENYTTSNYEAPLTPTSENRNYKLLYIIRELDPVITIDLSHLTLKLLFGHICSECSLCTGIKMD